MDCHRHRHILRGVALSRYGDVVRVALDIVAGMCLIHGLDEETSIIWSRLGADGTHDEFHYIQGYCEKSIESNADSY